MRNIQNSNLSTLGCKELHNLTRQFVRKYYETLNSSSNILYKFYDQDAILCHLEDEDHLIQYYMGIHVKRLQDIFQNKDCKNS